MMLHHSIAPSRTHEEGVAPKLVEAIASELWARCGRSGTLDWEAADRCLARIADEAREKARGPAGRSTTDVPTGLFPL
jgi:hypothetical protein